MRDRLCGNCRFYDAVDQECRRRAPSGEKICLMPDYWCGEHEHEGEHDRYEIDTTGPDMREAMKGFIETGGDTVKYRRKIHDGFEPDKGGMEDLVSWNPEFKARDDNIDDDARFGVFRVDNDKVYFVVKGIIDQQPTIYIDQFEDRDILESLDCFRAVRDYRNLNGGGFTAVSFGEIGFFTVPANGLYNEFIVRVVFDPNGK